MKITFIIPPALDNTNPAERTAGCTRLVYPMPNIYELTVAGLLEQDKHEVCYQDFVLNNEKQSGLDDFLKNDSSECYMLWCVNQIGRASCRERVLRLV